ncbi:hypothetical protein QYM36_019477 [Artemia franciscana]|uniref:Uncharacterized protein n=1 Tax=Artemia franciscana TaxID=6661 RepID=A0AA88KTS7_ARTSF|nr:hypothetical protein QYM36_019477 [Artemia franciscana]
MLQMKNEFEDQPLGESFCGVLNTLHYVTLILEDWEDTTLILRLNSSRQEPDAANLKLKSCEEPDMTVPALKDVSTSLNQVTEVMVFDSIIELFEKIEKDMVNLIVHTILRDVKDRSAYYRKTRWQMMFSMKDYIQPCLTPNLCKILQALQEGLQRAHQRLSQKEFLNVLKSVGSRVNKFFFEEIILENRFNEGGAEQLEYDIKNGLLPIFGQYSIRSSLIFSQIQESCLLLKMPVGDAFLLKKLLTRDDPAVSFRLSYAETSEKMQALREHGIYNLSVQNALFVFDRRIVGSAVKNLGKLKSQISVLTASISSLENKIDYSTLSKSDSVFAKLKESQEKVNQISIEAEQLSILIEGFAKDSEPLFCELFPLIDPVISAQNKIKYHQLLELGKCINYDLKDALHLKDYERITVKFKKLQEIYSQMHGTQCGNLQNYLQGLKQEWAKTIYLSVKRSVEDLLVEIGWPFISKNQPLENVKRTTDDGYKKFQSLLKILALLNNEVDPDSDCI